ncbi:MAG TPA: class I SAM-dependent methyltransferase [Chloroflexi bacterium]|nr:class I SAM-dependent methyltransferase [Chloroflexota bacterium]
MSSKEYFDDVARQWNTMREVFFSDAVRDRAISMAQVQPGQIAADIGAGSGFVTEGLLERGLRVIAVDQSPVMLEEIGRKIASPEALDCRVGQAERLPLDDEAVDHVFANMYLHHVESPLDAIEEMVRILRPGGGLVITDLDEHNFQFLRTEQHDLWLGFKREDVQAWLCASGLIDVVLDSVGEDCCSQSECGADPARISIFLAYGRKGIPSDQRTGSRDTEREQG